MLRISNFTKIYHSNKKAVDNISLHVDKGDIYGFIGHNGAGKTTAIRAIVGVMDFNKGEILIDGNSIRKEPIKCKSIMSYIPDNPDLYEYLTGIQYLNFIANVFSIEKSKRNNLIKKYADSFEIFDDLGSLISSYSHGMKQKLALISAFIREPKLLVLDEPFVGLDPKAAHILKIHMHDICSRGSSIFFSTHVLDVAEKLCNKVAIIKQGKLITSDKIEGITKNQSLEDVFMELISHE